MNLFSIITRRRFITFTLSIFVQPQCKTLLYLFKAETRLAPLLRLSPLSLAYSSTLITRRVEERWGTKKNLYMWARRAGKQIPDTKMSTSISRAPSTEKANERGAWGGNACGKLVIRSITCAQKIRRTAKIMKRIHMAHS